MYEKIKTLSHLLKVFIVALLILFLCSFSHLVSIHTVCNRRDQTALIIQLRTLETQWETN